MAMNTTGNQVYCHFHPTYSVVVSGSETFHIAFSVLNISFTGSSNIIVFLRKLKITRWFFSLST